MSYLLVLFISASITYLLAGPVREYALNAEAHAKMSARGVRRQPIPRLGGIAIFGGLCAGLFVASQLTDLSPVFQTSNHPRALLSGAGLVWLFGILDDRFGGIDPMVKAGSYMLAAGIMVVQGLTIEWLTVPGVGSVALTSLQGTLLATGLVAMIIFAVTYVDELDGLAVGLICIGSVTYFLFAYQISHTYGIDAALPGALIAAILTGVCLGFLPHNMHPAQIRLGSSGSMLLGLALAADAISITGHIDPDALRMHAGSGKDAVQQALLIHSPLLLSLAAIAVPLANVHWIWAHRSWRGRTPLGAHRGHLHHHLLERGHSLRRTVLIMCFWSALIAFDALAFSVHLTSIWTVLASVILLAIGLVLTLLPHFAWRTQR